MKNPTKEQIRRAYSEGCADVKRVLKTLWPEVVENPLNLYIFDDQIDDYNKCVGIGNNGADPSCDNVAIQNNDSISHEYRGKCLILPAGYDWKIEPSKAIGFDTPSRWPNLLIGYKK